MTRPSWSFWFISLAQFVSYRSRDPSTRVGAVIARPDNTVASIGYNDFPRGISHQPQRYTDRDFRLKAMVHAERNAILNAHEPLAGCRLFTTFHPCSECAKEIIQSGIRCIVIRDRLVPDRWKEDMDFSRALLREAGVDVHWLDEPNLP